MSVQRFSIPLIIALVVLFSSCAPGTFNRSRGVPIGVGDLYTLSINSTGTSLRKSLDLRFNAVSQAARVYGKNAFVIGNFIVTFNQNANVDNVEWLDFFSENRYYLVYSAQINGRNYLYVDIDKSVAGRDSSCVFSDWKYGDQSFSGLFAGFVESESGSGSFTRLTDGRCTLQKK